MFFQNFLSLLYSHLPTFGAYEMYLADLDHVLMIVDRKATLYCIEVHDDRRASQNAETLSQFKVYYLKYTDDQSPHDVSFDRLLRTANT